VRFVAKAFGVVFLLATALVVVVVLRLDATVRGRLLVKAAEVEARLGRRVTLGDVHVGFGATAFAEVRDLSVGPVEGAVGEAARPPLTIARIRLGLATGPLLRSGGRDLEVVSIEVEGPEITLVRLDGGGLSTDDVRTRLRDAPPPPPPPPTHSRVTGIDRLTIERGAFSFYDRTNPSAPPIKLDSLRLEAASPSLDAPMSLNVEVGISSKQPNLRAAIDLAPVRTVATSACPVRRAELHLEPVSLAAFTSFVTAPWADLSGATLGVDAVMECASDLHVAGTVGLTGVRLVSRDGHGSAEAGAPVGGHLKGELRFDPKSGDLDVPAFELAVGTASAVGHSAVRDVRAARELTSLSVAFQGDPDEMIGVLPPPARPHGAVVHGPVRFHADLEQREGRLGGPVDFEVAEVGAEGAARTSLALRGDLAIAANGDAIELRAASMRLGDRAEAEGSLELAGLRETPHLTALSVAAKGRIESVLALSPGKQTSGVALAGPFAASVDVAPDDGGLRGQLKADLSGSMVRTATFQKPPGVALRAEASARFHGGELAVDHARVVVGDATLQASGRGTDVRRLSARFEADVPSLRSFTGLFPQAAARVPGDVAGDSRVVVSGTLDRLGESTDVHARVGLRSARVESPRLSMAGDSDLAGQVRIAGAALQADVEADLTATSLRAPGQYDKPAGATATVAFAVERSGDRLSLRRGRATLPGASVGDASVELTPGHFDVNVASVALDAAPLARTMPGLAHLPAFASDARIALALHVEGDPQVPEAARVAADRVELVTRVGTVRGHGDVDDLRAPKRIVFDLASEDLDLDALGLGSGPAPPMRVLPDGLRALSVEGRVRLARAKLGGEVVRAVALDASLSQGVLDVREARAQVFGGLVDGGGSRLDLAGPAPRFTLRASVADVDLASLPRAGDSMQELRGRAGLTVRLDGEGSTTAEVQASLRGDAHVELREVHLKSERSVKSKVVRPVLASLSNGASKSPDERVADVDLREATASLRIARGAVTTTEPIRLTSSDGTLTLDGRLGFDGVVAFRGVLTLPPSAIDRATRGKLVPLHDIDVRFRITGKEPQPKVEVTNLGEVVTGFRGSLINATALHR